MQQNYQLSGARPKTLAVAAPIWSIGSIMFDERLLPTFYVLARCLVSMEHGYLVLHLHSLNDDQKWRSTTGYTIAKTITAATITTTSAQTYRHVPHPVSNVLPVACWDRIWQQASLLTFCLVVHGELQTGHITLSVADSRCNRSLLRAYYCWRMPVLDLTVVRRHVVDLCSREAYFMLHLEAIYSLTLKLEQLSSISYDAGNVCRCWTTKPAMFPIYVLSVYYF